MARKIPRPSSDAPQLSLGFGAPPPPPPVDARRIFLDWNKPCLVAAAEHLTKLSKADGSFDLRHLIVVTPVARAGARLLEILVDRAAALKRPLLPPRVITTGSLAELLVPPSLPSAHPAVRALLWAICLRDAPVEVRSPVLPEPPGHDDWNAWMRLGKMIDQLDSELAGADVTFASVVDKAASLESFRGPERWVALAALREAFALRLAELDLDDPHARRRVPRDQVCLQPPAEQIVLVGAADLNGMTLRLLDAVAPHVLALVHAPASLATRFDRFGCILDASWESGPVGGVEVSVVDGPAEQASHVLGVLASLDDACLEDVVIGVPDAEAIPFLRDTLEQTGVPVRNAAGRATGRTGPYLLFATLADYLDAKEFATLATLARHPELARRLEEGSEGDWRARLDEYQANHVPRTVDQDWLGAPDAALLLRNQFQVVESMLGDLRGAPRPLSRWAEALAGVFAFVYGDRELDPSVEADRVVVEVCGAFRGVLRALYDLPDSIAGSVGAADATRMVLNAVAEEAIPDPPEREAVELLGWLELPYDDAPVLIVTGFNEGFVPGSLNADAFLPDGLRAHLGLVDNRHRFARDAFLLSSMVAWREQTTLIVPRRSSSGDPLSLSRLALTGDGPEVAARLLAFYKSGGAAASPGLGKIQPGRDTPDLPVPAPRDQQEPLRGLHVTGFRDYLACPYRFYLRHVEHLARTDDTAVELDARLFGILAHDVLNDFGESTLSTSADAFKIGAYLVGRLDERARERFGAHAHPAVRIQVEQLRERLRAFSEWQSKWVRGGKRILRSELPVTGQQAPFDVDGEPFYLRGRIDRIDRDEATGELYLLDYKFGAKAREPDKAHRNRQGWVDLQLPLYRHLAAAAGMQGPFRLGYVCLPHDAAEVTESLAAWSVEDLESADAVAGDVIRNLRKMVFWPPAEVPPIFSEDFADICQQGQLRLIDDVDVADEEESA